MEQNLNSQAQEKFKIEDLVDGAFGKGLAATIMAWFPIASIVAIGLAAASKSALSEAKELGRNFNIELGGKSIAAKVLNTVGLVSGIVMTAFWGLYFLLIIGIILGSM